MSFKTLPIKNNASLISYSSLGIFHVSAEFLIFDGKNVIHMEPQIITRLLPSQIAFLTFIDSFGEKERR